MKRIALLIAIGVAIAFGFLKLGNAKSAEGPAQGGNLVAAGAKKKDAAARSASVVPVLTAEVSNRNLRQLLDVTGSLRTDQDVQVGTRIEGRVVRCDVKEGDRVKQGQLLVKLDDREMRSQIEQARALLSSARAKLSLAQNQASFKDTTAKSEFERASAVLTGAKTRVQQAETNVKIIEVQAKANTDTMRARVVEAEQRLNIAKDLTRKQVLRQEQLSVEQAKARLGQSKVDAENAKQVLARRQTLYKQDAIAKEEVDEADRKFKSAESAVTVAQADVEAANQKLDLAKEGSRNEEIIIAEGALAAARRNYDQAKSDEQKIGVAKQEVENARDSERQAQAAVNAAQAGLVQPKLSLDDIRAANAQVQQASADIAYYTTRLEDLTIKAPVSGVVANLMVHPGETVTTSMKLMRLVALDTVYFEASVPELEIGMVRTGTQADVTIDALPGKKYKGSIREIIPVADAASRAFRVRVAVLGAGNQLPANGFARATIHVGERKEVPSITRDAVHIEAGDKYVLLVSDDDQGGYVAKRQGVTLGISDGDYVQVLSGIKTGDKVVAAGSPAIIEGTPVALQGKYRGLK